MSAYTLAIKQLRTSGYITDEVMKCLSMQSLQRAIEEASKPA